MVINIAKTTEELGVAAAGKIAELLRAAIKERGEARLVLSTGASQFTTIAALLQEDVDFSKVTMFHLDEYVHLPETHIASFRKYLKERFIERTTLKGAFLVNGNGDIAQNIAELTNQLRKAPIDVGVIGIGENGHIAFNDPPADFHTKEAYHVVNLDQRCRAQQIGEGWFPDDNAVPKQAISMTVHQIMQCCHIVSPVPFAVKAEAIRMTLEQNVSNMVPATLLKTHEDWSLFLDADSASGVIGSVDR